jgi:hypothetical protein
MMLPTHGRTENHRCDQASSGGALPDSREYAAVLSYTCTSFLLSGVPAPAWTRSKSLILIVSLSPNVIVWWIYKRDYGCRGDLVWWVLQV